VGSSSTEGATGQCRGNRGGKAENKRTYRGKVSYTEAEIFKQNA